MAVPVGTSARVWGPLQSLRLQRTFCRGPSHGGVGPGAACGHPVPAMLRPCDQVSWNVQTWGPLVKGSLTHSSLYVLGVHICLRELLAPSSWGLTGQGYLCKTPGLCLAQSCLQSQFLKLGTLKDLSWVPLEEVALGPCMACES